MERNRICETIKILAAITIALLLMQCNRTPKEYVSRTSAPRDVYTKDSIYLKKVAWHIFKNHLGGFDGTSYDRYTGFYLDSIIYSPNLTKMLFWIITEDSTHKVSGMEEDIKHPSMCYNGCYMFAFRKSLNETLKVSESFSYMSVFNKSYKEAHESLYQECFVDKRFYKDSNGHKKHSYDDIRVWQDIDWIGIDQDPYWCISDTGMVKIGKYKPIKLDTSSF